MRVAEDALGGGDAVPRRGPRGSRDVKAGELRGVLRPLRRIRGGSPARALHLAAETCGTRGRGVFFATDARVRLREEEERLLARVSSRIDPRGGPSAAGRRTRRGRRGGRGRARSGSPRLHREARALLSDEARGARMRSPRGERGALAFEEGLARAPVLGVEGDGAATARDERTNVHQRADVLVGGVEASSGRDRAMDSSGIGAAAAAYRLKARTQIRDGGSIPPPSCGTAPRRALAASPPSHSRRLDPSPSRAADEVSPRARR